MSVLSSIRPASTHQRAGDHHPRVIVSHSGKQHAYRHALAVQSAGCLHRFITSGYYIPSRVPDRFARAFATIDAAFRRRRLDGIVEERIVRRWRYEIPELIALRLLGNGRVVERLVHRRDIIFDRWASRTCADQGDLFWGFQGSCLESLRAARNANRVAVAEFSTAHVTEAVRLLRLEAERHPEWATTISNFHFSQSYRHRLEQEPHEADYCVAASSFTAKSLEAAGVSSSRIRLLPLGADLTQFRLSARPTSGKFRVLFVGGVGQRKGIKYLLEAYNRMRSPSTELVVAGPLPADIRPLAKYSTFIRCTGRIDQSEVIREMSSAHVLVLPSVFEGFGLVIPEAMATGLPVIASTHSAGPDIIRHGQDGYIIEPDDIEGLAAHLSDLAVHRNLTDRMGREAAERAKDFSWDVHRRRVKHLLNEFLRLEQN